MHVEQLSSVKATTKLAQQRRPIIDPSAEYDLQALLDLVDENHTDPDYYEQILDGLRYHDPATAAPDPASATTAADQPQPTADSSTSQQAAMDERYHQYLQSLTPEQLDFVQLDFVRQDEQWPAIRTSHNRLAEPGENPHTTKDWHSHRSRFIVQTYLEMHGGDDTVMETLLNKMFDDGNYS